MRTRQGARRIEAELLQYLRVEQVLLAVPTPAHVVGLVLLLFGVVLVKLDPVLAYESWGDAEFFRWMKATAEVGMLAWALRYALFGLMPSSVVMVVFGIVLHGICYDFFFVTGQLYTDRVAPKEMRTSAQALVGLLTYGAGMLVGNYVLGFWGDSLGLDPSTKEGWLADGRSFWLMPAIFAAVVSAVFFMTFWDRDPKGQEA